jgi:hypothetical protein
VLNSGENSLVFAAYKASLLLPNGFAKKFGKIRTHFLIGIYYMQQIKNLIKDIYTIGKKSCFVTKIQLIAIS